MDVRPFYYVLPDEIDCLRLFQQREWSSPVGRMGWGGGDIHREHGGKVQPF